MPSSTWSPERLTPWFLCAAALLLRLIVSAAFPNIAHPDETFQYLEQAHRALTGQGLVPWEYVAGARSWVIAGMLTPLLIAARAFSADPAVAVWFVTAFMSVLAALNVLAAYRLGEMAGGPAHALFAGVLGATWSELVYLSPHVLADTLCAVPLLWGLVFAQRAGQGTRNVLFAGICFGLVLVERVQLAPALLVAVAWTCRAQPLARLSALALGAVVPLAVMGVVDWITWGAPFASLEMYVMANLSGVAAGFGVAPFSYYVQYELAAWSITAPLLLVTALIGAWRLPGPAIVGLAVLLTFSFVDHKEERFVYPALPIFFTLCGIGTGQMLSWIRRGTQRRLAASLMVLAWIMASVASAAGPRMRYLWYQQAGPLRALDAINRDRAACGLGIAPTDAWPLTGRVRLRDDVALFDASPARVAQDAGAFNNILTFGEPVSEAYERAGFGLVACDPQSYICRYQRAGGCRRGSTPPLQAHPPPHVQRALEDMARRWR